MIGILLILGGLAVAGGAVALSGHRTASSLERMRSYTRATAQALNKRPILLLDPRVTGSTLQLGDKNIAVHVKRSGEHTAVDTAWGGIDIQSHAPGFWDTIQRWRPVRWLKAAGFPRIDQYRNSMDFRGWDAGVYRRNGKYRIHDVVLSDGRTVEPPVIGGYMNLRWTHYTNPKYREFVYEYAQRIKRDFRPIQVELDTWYATLPPVTQFAAGLIKEAFGEHIGTWRLFMKGTAEEQALGLIGDSDRDQIKQFFIQSLAGEFAGPTIWQEWWNRGGGQLVMAIASIVFSVFTGGAGLMAGGMIRSLAARLQPVIAQVKRAYDSVQVYENAFEAAIRSTMERYNQLERRATTFDGGAIADLIAGAKAAEQAVVSGRVIGTPGLPGQYDALATYLSASPKTITIYEPR